MGQANQRGNGNARLSRGSDSSFRLEVRNWAGGGGDFSKALFVPEHWRGLLNRVIERAESVRLGRNGQLLEGGLPYSVRVIRSDRGYQVLVSFEPEEPEVDVELLYQILWLSAPNPDSASTRTNGTEERGGCQRRRGGNRAAHSTPRYHPVPDGVRPLLPRH